MTSSRSRPRSHGSSSVNTVTHWRQEQGIRVMSVPQNIRSAPNEPGFPRIGLVRAIGVGLGLGEFLTGHATDEPSVAAEQLVQAFEQSCRVDTLGPPPAR